MNPVKLIRGRTISPGVLLLIAAVPICSAHPEAPRTLCDQTEIQAKANCRLVVNFYDAFFNRHDIKAADQAVAHSYVQHNPQLPNGREALVEFFTRYFREHPRAAGQIFHVGTSGDLVWLHVHAVQEPDDRGAAIVDIFRVQDGRIAEHWDVIQPVAEKSANDNTMF